MRLQLFPEPVLKRKIHPLNFLIFGLFTVIFLGSLLLWAPFSHKGTIPISYVNALFTATSASTVTGLAAVDTADTYNFFGQLVILLLINMGGLGYMTLITFFLLSRDALGLKYALFMKESLNLPSLGDIFQLAKKVFFTIFVFELLGVVFLTLFWKSSGFGFFTSLWYGIFHAMSAFNNAGFDLMGHFQSFTAYTTHPLFNFTIMALIFFGGIGVLVISDIFGVLGGMRRTFTVHSKIVITTSLILIITGAFFFFILERENLLQNYDTGGKIIVSAFQSVTARTAGFSTVDISLATPPTLLLLDFLMFIGASPGSTGAGIKTTTFAIFVFFIVAAFRNKEQPEAFGRRIARESVEKAFLLLLLALFVVFGGVVLLSFWEPFKPQQILFEVISAFGTVGLSTGITPSLTSTSKLVLSMVMFIGRLTPLTLLVWLSIKKKSRVELLEEGVAVG